MSLERMFEEELIARAISFEGPNEDGSYCFDLGEVEAVVHLDNLRKMVSEESMREDVASFVVALLENSGIEPLSWDEAKHHIFFEVYPNSDLMEGMIAKELTQDICKTLVHLDNEETAVTYIQEFHLQEWDVSLDELISQAMTNQDTLAAQATLEILTPEDGLRTGYMELNSTIRASVILAPNFRSMVEGQLGWPVLALLPCRDFLYLIAVEDLPKIGTLAPIVGREYQESAYPVTLEVLELSDEGIRGIGSFRQKESDT